MHIHMRGVRVVEKPPSTKKREKEYERDMTESLRLLRVSRAPAGDLVCSNKETLRQVSETHQSYKSNTVIGQS